MVQAISNYSFNASAKTITFSDFGSINIERINAVLNLTTGQWIYNATDPLNYGGTVATNVLTFTASNAGMANGDKLFIRYDSPLSIDTQVVSIAAGTNAIGKLAANDTVDIGDVTINNASGGSAVNIQDGGNSITVDGTFWQATQPVSASSLPLPSGASTAAKQPALGTAGTPSADVLTVQGATSMTALKVDGSGVTQPISGTVTVNALPAGTNAIGKLAANDAVDIGDVTINNASGGSAVNIQDGGNSITVDGTVGISGTVTVGAHAVTNAGTFAVQDSEKLADNAAFTDGTTKVTPIGFIYDEVAGTALTENDIAAGRLNVNRAIVNTIEDGATRGRYATVTAANAVKVDGSGVTQPISGTVTINAIPAGTANIGDVDVLTVPADPFGANADAIVAAGATGSISAKLRRATQGLEDLKTGVVLATGSNVIGALTANQSVNVAQINGVTALMGNGATGTGSQRVTIANDNSDIPIKIQAQTTGGLTTYHLVSAGSTNATVLKASAGQIYGWYIYNSSSSARKVVFHNASSTPTAGASVFFSLMIPATSGANVFSEIGIPFSTGISMTTVTGLADSDAAAVSANDLIINIWYK